MTQLREEGAGNPIEPQSNFARARSRKRELLSELSAVRAEGGPLRPEDLLVHWPTDPASDPDVASLLFTDYQQRQARGETPSSDDYQERFPEQANSLRSLVQQHELLRSLGGGSDPRTHLSLPAVGQEIFGFRLCGELGSGAFARVFLAEQASLAGRPVVLKTSDLKGDEPQTLAQLQHTHIVPIYSVHEDHAAGLRAVCMPYFGGASLSVVLRALWATTNRPTRVAELVSALEQTDSQKKSTRPVSRSPGLLVSLSYLQASAWVVARLAEGLQHAHDCGVLHRDIKPSNILLGGDAQPMLLDFNLAHKQHQEPATELGGTVAYMAPEHLRALRGRTPELIEKVDHRCDIYSLGMVLFEMLTGHNPFDQSGSYSPLPVMIEAMAVERSRAAPSVRARRPDVPWSLESILRKCLAPLPADRYQQAEHLAEDLRRFLDDRPLRYAPELSWTERGRKWLRRHPRLTSSASVATAAGLLLALTGAALLGVRAHLETARNQERQRSFRKGTDQALLLVNTTLDLHDHLPQGQAVCEETLALYGILQRDDWQQQKHWKQLGPAERQRLAEDARELLLLLAWARVRGAEGSEAALQEALALLDSAEAIDLPPSHALWQERLFYRRQLGDQAGAQAALAQAQRLPPRSAREHYLLATAIIRHEGESGAQRAIDELNRSVALDPQFYWAWLQRGICHLKAGDQHLAAADFGVCIGLQPGNAFGYFNLGCTLGQSGRWEEAVSSYSSALEQSPDFSSAYLNRGMALLELKRHDEALADFTRASALAPQDAALHAGAGLALEGLHRGGEADLAFVRAFDHLLAAPRAVQERVRCGYGFAVYRRKPEAAREAFDAVLKHNPRHPEALYGRALLAAEASRPEEAIDFLDQVIAVAPHAMEARRHLAIQLSRCRRFPDAFRVIDWCLEREPDVGATLYAAACVAARAADHTSHSLNKLDLSPLRYREQAIRYLSQAFARGYGRDIANQDPDLSALRNDPCYQRLVLVPTERGNENRR